jgi:hypothetical protein
MTFWYVLIISFSTPFEGLSTVVPYADPQACGAAILSIETALSHSADINAIQCKETSVAMSSIRPKRRPG